jgi:selenocysteine-specific elongation factor
MSQGPRPLLAAAAVESTATGRAPPSDMKSIVVGTAGHIDHGKSALVKALTGTDPDRLLEEKRRGITIDLGFAHLELDARAAAPADASTHDEARLRLSFIDVPGHERFVRNMLAGVGGIDLVLLVIAADETVKPQTREHFEICRLLRIPAGVVALTKSDLVDADLLGLVRLEAEDFLRGSFLASAPIVPVSAHTGAGLDQLRRALRDQSALARPRDADLPARLPVDRVFSMKGFGTVVTGTLVSGRLAAGDEVEAFGGDTIQSRPRRMRVRGVQVHGNPAASAVAGERTAANVVAAGAGNISPRDLGRGTMLCEPGIFQPSRYVNAELELLDSAPPLKDRTRVHLHAYSAETTASVLLLEGRALAPGSRGWVQLDLADPVPLVPGDRFIIRRFSPVVTIGGGEVVEVLAPRRRMAGIAVFDGAANARHEALRADLQVLKTAPRAQRIELSVARAGPGGISLTDLAARVGLRPEAIAAEITADDSMKQALIPFGPPPSFIALPFMVSLENRTLAALREFHRAQPLVEGIVADDLRGRVGAMAATPASAAESTPPSAISPSPVSPSAATAAAPPTGRRRADSVSPGVFSAALARLIAAGKVELNGDRLRLRGQRVAFSDQETEARAAIEAAFRNAGLQAPAVRQVLAGLPVDAARAEKILRLLLRDRVLVKVSDELIFHQSALDHLVEILQGQKSRSPRLTVTTFKDLTGVSRKYAIPLLEYLDSRRITRRAGDEREIL